MKYETAHCTLLGNRRMNQDRCLILEAPDAMLVALADGMGGHPRGEMAAQILMDTCRRAFLTSRKPISGPRVFLSGLMEMAHRRILDYGREQEPHIEPRTTAVLCLIQEGQAFWAHVGDSRLYIMRDNVILSRTEDHSYVEQLRQQGIISAAQVQTHRFRNYVTRCLGGISNRPVAELGEPHRLEEGDVVLLCSDGFWGKLPARPMVDAFFRADQALQSAVNQLSSLAESNGMPESDNVTAVAVRWRRDTIDLRPTDLGMTLVDNAAGTARLPRSEHEIKQAIEELRDVVDIHHDLKSKE
ncbi:MAG: serine/threonine protein phosphatase [Gammaproteobacteria bacterium (ex Lamellibrachia satsuma)]|nr:MAG: serine/threonine-protein phosphatase [Gammaproteobacteria bacterium (ex Lamellibrachia satsuma)]RRS31006.1 MAG: serine/threonine protein phosphatase [Gammaproteobacteria bacterium (ex Lamellibrachia satsuma)]RRS36019.1 MAG: serine/threonine protein phosphatase [Gammaproteobacteria bacterium (ex Lamellibrachia satsuma)]